MGPHGCEEFCANDTTALFCQELIAFFTGVVTHSFRKLIVRYRAVVLLIILELNLYCRIHEPALLPVEVPTLKE